MLKRRLSLVVASGLTAAVAAAALPDVNVATNKGPSTASTPYLVPTAAGVRTVSILTVGESVGPKLDGVTPYTLIGIPDGLGAFDRGDGTFQLVMNHEIANNLGVARAHGSIGGTVSSWIIDRETLAVKSGGDLVRTTHLWDFANQKWNQATTAFNRLCSADLAAPSAYFDPVTGKGTRERLFLSGEESGTTGRAFAHVATGPNAGASFELPRLGRDSWENLAACPAAQEKTIVISQDDTTPGQVYVYVGTKLAAGSEVQKAGLANGKLYGVIANAIRFEDRTTGIGIAKGGSAPFSLADLGDQSAAGGSAESAADTAGVTEFLRPEDGAWDPVHPADYYFVTTDRFDQTKNGTGSQVGRSRLWRLRFTDIANPTAGGTISMLLDGTEAHNMFDNLCVDRTGHVLIQEDTGGVSWTARVWRYDIATGTLTEVARHDPARFGSETLAATLPFSIDEESSGIIDASDLLGPGWFLCDVQAHGGTLPGTELVENGQLLALYDPACAAPPTFTVAPTANPAAPVAGQDVTFSVQADVPGHGAITYAWDFADGGTGTGAGPTHRFVAPGSYHVVVTATHTATGKTATAALDLSVGRSWSTPSLKIDLDFDKTGKDELDLDGDLPLPGGFDPKGKVIRFDVGGIVRTFTLDARGHAKSGDGSVRLQTRDEKDCDSWNSTSAARRVPFSFTIDRASLASSLTDEGLGNVNVCDQPVAVRVSVQLDGRTYDAIVDLIYDAKAGKRGVAK